MVMEKAKVKVNKPIYFGFSILDLSKIVMYEFCYDYIEQKYGKIAKLCYTDRDSFIIYIKTEDFYSDIFEDVDKRFDTSSYVIVLNRPLPTGKNKKVIGLMKDELGGKIMTEFVAFRPKTYSYLTDDGNIDKKLKGTKNCIIKTYLSSIITKIG